MLCKTIFAIWSEHLQQRSPLASFSPASLQGSKRMSDIQIQTVF